MKLTFSKFTNHVLTHTTLAVVLYIVLFPHMKISLRFVYLDIFGPLYVAWQQPIKVHYFNRTAAVMHSYGDPSLFYKEQRLLRTKLSAAPDRSESDDRHLCLWHFSKEDDLWRQRTPTQEDAGFHDEEYSIVFMLSKAMEGNLTTACEESYLSDGSTRSVRETRRACAIFSSW